MRFLATFQIYDFLDTLVSLASAFVLGTLIGAERQYRQRSGGLRTNVLVAVGAATFVDIGQHLAGNAGATQIIAYVVSGVGFLGAGSILRQGEEVKGLTTAATIWVVASLGMAIGFGYYTIGIVATVMVMVTLVALRPIEDRFFPMRHTRRRTDPKPPETDPQ